MKTILKELTIIFLFIPIILFVTILYLIAFITK